MSGFTSIEITHQFKNLDGTAASGTVRFRLTTRMTNSGLTYDPVVPLVVTLDSSGNLSATLPANNDPTTVSQVPAGYLVALQLNGSSSQPTSGEEYEITVPYNAVGGTVDLGTLLPAQVGA